MSVWEVWQHPQVGVGCATGCLYVVSVPRAARSLCLQPAASAQAPPSPEMWGHLPIHPHRVCPHRSFLCLAAGPGAGLSTPKPQETLSMGARGTKPLCPHHLPAPHPRAACCSGCPAVQMASPPRRVAASTLTCGCFLCPFSLRVGLTPSLPPLRRPRPPAQPPPEPATHTSELFCVFQQLKRIKQQLSPGRAWILVTLIFCVAGQGEWGY